MATRMGRDRKCQRSGPIENGASRAEYMGPRADPFSGSPAGPPGAAFGPAALDWHRARILDRNRALTCFGVSVYRSRSCQR